MWNAAVVGLKPDTDWTPLLELVPGLVHPGGRLDLVSSVRVGKEGDEAERLGQAQAALESTMERFQGEGYSVELHVGLVAAAPGIEILRIAEETSTELIIIGLTKRSRVGKALVGSDSQRVLLEADVPVLALRIA